MSDSIEKYIQEQRELYEAFSTKFDEIKRSYIDKKDVKETRKELQKLASDYSKCYHAWCDFLEYGCDIFDKGEEIVYLNKWEKAYFDVDAFLMEVGSGGVDSWLHMCGHRFEQTKKALQTIRAEKGYHFMEEIEKRFPKGKVPKSYERLEKILDKMIDNDEDFEEEENCYYWDEGVEAELVDCLYQFVMDNKKRFR